MNETQEKYLKIIHALINLPEINYYTGNFGYGLSNYIAKFSLANNTYKISNEAFILLNNSIPGFNNILLRQTKQCNAFTYEHPIPINIIRSKLLALQNKTSAAVQEILNHSDHVTIITKIENRELSINGLKQRFPIEIEWIPNENTFLRYQVVGINLHINSITMQGAIIR